MGDEVYCPPVPPLTLYSLSASVMLRGFQRSMSAARWFLHPPVHQPPPFFCCDTSLFMYPLLTVLRAFRETKSAAVVPRHILGSLCFKSLRKWPHCSPTRGFLSVHPRLSLPAPSLALQPAVGVDHRRCSVPTLPPCAALPSPSGTFSTRTPHAAFTLP